jgi:hypothetical protein
MDNKKILEALKMQPLSEEEKAARHILGRLYGPIATCIEATRNGRLYNRELWEKALKDEIFNETVATKSLFLELGHPADREETDMSKVCAIIPECPKIIGDELYAYVDILDTANGRILKTLCDYGFVPGISSRGSGDVMPNNEVDPETFFLQTWDIVQLPAVKKARLSVCESLDRKNMKLKKALVESLQKANDEDKAIMKETLDKLDIELDEDLPAFVIPTPTKISEIPMAEDDGLLEDADVEEVEVEEVPVEDTEVEEPADETESEATEEVEETTDEADAEEEVETIAAEEEPMTVGQFLDGFKDMDTEMPITINSLELDGKTYETDLEFEVKDGELFVNVSCVASEEETEETSEEDNTEEETEDATEETEAEETVDETEEAVDDGDDEVVESMKALVRQNSALAEEVKTLKKQNAETKTAGDARVNELQEELDKYKAAFAKVSAVASRGKKSVAELQEQLTIKDTKIEQLNQQLTESATKDKTDIKRLQENLSTTQKESSETIKSLHEEVNKQMKLANDRTALAKRYKGLLNEAVQKYIDFRASMLGVKPADITNRLNEKYTFADIDAVCEDLLTANTNISRLPINSGRVTTRINESAKPKKTAPVNEWSYEVDDTLLELAGLKK